LRAQRLDPRIKTRQGQERISENRAGKQGFLRRCLGVGIASRWIAKRVTWQEADEIPSLSVICTILRIGNFPKISANVKKIRRFVASKPAKIGFNTESPAQN